MANIFTIAPTTTDERISRISEAGLVFSTTSRRCDRCRKKWWPVCPSRPDQTPDGIAGRRFRNFEPEHVREVGSVADGVVVGVMNCILKMRMTSGDPEDYGRCGL